MSTVMSTAIAFLLVFAAAPGGACETKAPEKASQTPRSYTGQSSYGFCSASLLESGLPERKAQMEKESIGQAMRKCRNAGFNHCEMTGTYIASVPMDCFSPNGYVIEASVDGYNVK